MRSLTRLVFVWSLALAFVASGAAWRHCMALQLSVPAAHVQTAHDHASHDHTAHDHTAYDTGSHNHGSSHHAAADQAVDDNGKPASNNHDCNKCSICTIAGAVLSSPVETAFETHAVTFSLRCDTRTGSASPVDPGIPKLIA